MCIFKKKNPVGGVVVVAVGYTRACMHLWPVWSGHTWHVLYLTHGPRGMSAEHVPTPALTHIGLRPTRTQELRSQK